MRKYLAPLLTIAIIIVLCIQFASPSIVQSGLNKNQKLNMQQKTSQLMQQQAKSNATAQVHQKGMSFDMKLEMKPHLKQLSQPSPYFETSSSLIAHPEFNKRQLSQRELFTSNKRSAVQKNNTVKLAFLNDMHLEPQYVKKRNEQYDKAKDAGFMTLQKSMEKLSPQAKAYMHSLTTHIFTQMRNISELYVTQKNFSSNLTEMQNYTQTVMNVAIKQKIWDTQQFLTKAKDLDRDVFNELTEFINKEFYPDNWRVAESLPMEICQNLPELTGSDEFKSCHQDMGVYGFDAPKKLIDAVVDRMVNKSSDIDAIVLNGDFIAHNHAGNKNMTLEEKNETWTSLKEIIGTDMQALRNKFPGKVLLPTIGNNDVIVHNSVPCNEDVADMYYTELYDIWFPKSNLPPNFDWDANNETFSHGGYYRYDFSGSQLSFIGLNTMFFNRKNQCMLDRGDDQLLWLQKLLQQNQELPDPRQFIISMHVFPGLNDFNKEVEVFWHNESLSTFLNYIEQYQDNIQFLAGAHIHRGQLRAPQSSSKVNISVPLLVTTSITPVYRNNPSYTTLEIMTSHKFNKTQHYEFGPLLVQSFQLQYYLLAGVSAWHEMDPKEQFGLDLNNRTSLRKYDTFIENSMDLGALDGFNAGMDKYVREALYGFLFYPLYIDMVDKQDLPLYLCSLMWYEESDGFQQCFNDNPTTTWKI